MAGNIVHELLRGSHTYENWSACLKNYFIAQEIWDEVIERSDDPPKVEEAEVEFKTWKKKNAAALHAIQISCSADILSRIRDITSAKLCWDNLARDCIKKSPYEDPGSKEHEFVKYVTLCKAIDKGDLNDVRSFLHDNNDAVKIKITEHGFTALHLATSRANIDLVEELMELMSNEEIEITDNRQRTALYISARIGATEIAKLLVRKNKKLVTIPSTGFYLPVTAACKYGNKDTALFLYSQTPFELLLQEQGIYGTNLLIEAVTNELFGKALLGMANEMTFSDICSNPI